MNFKQAVGILKPTENTVEAIRAGYREQTKLYHPDINPNGLEMMKLINLAFEFLKEHCGKWDYQRDFTAGPSLAEDIQAIFEKVKTFVDINCEVCGAWLWISGNTKPYKEQLKEMNLRWSRNKTAWYWRPEGYRKRSKRVFSMGEIRQTWGSYEMEQEPLTAVS